MTILSWLFFFTFVRCDGGHWNHIAILKCIDTWKILHERYIKYIVYYLYIVYLLLFRNKEVGYFIFMQLRIYGCLSILILVYTQKKVPRVMCRAHKVFSSKNFNKLIYMPITEKSQTDYILFWLTFYIFFWIYTRT